MSDRYYVHRRAGPPAVVWTMAAVMILFELAFQFAESGMLPVPDLRFEAYLYLGFWDALFELARDGQRVPPEFWSSILTYALLHGGLAHLLMNGVILLSLGGILAHRLGSARFLTLFFVTAAAGALTFALIAETRGPLVGASGAIFGFFGALKRWEWRYIRATGAPANRFWGTILALIAINAILHVSFFGNALAWEAHLGGFVAGYLLAPLLAPGQAGPSPI